MSQPATSIAAFEKMHADKKVERSYKLILAALKYGNYTALEIAEVVETHGYRISYSEVSRRLPELREDGRVVRLDCKGKAPSGAERAFKYQIVNQ